jgi:hypothetical protein
MSSPFADSANAQIFFRVPTSSMVEDKNGNLAPAEIEQRIVALLIPSTPSPRIKAGMDEFDEYLKGYLVEPLEMPVNISPLMEGRIVRRMSSSTEIEGTFRLLPQAQSPFLISTGVQGVFKISGLFRAR